MTERRAPWALGPSVLVFLAGCSLSTEPSGPLSSPREDLSGTPSGRTLVPVLPFEVPGGPQGSKDGSAPPPGQTPASNPGREEGAVLDTLETGLLALAEEGPVACEADGVGWVIDQRVVTTESPAASRLRALVAQYVTPTQCQKLGGACSADEPLPTYLGDALGVLFYGSHGGLFARGPQGLPGLSPPQKAVVAELSRLPAVARCLRGFVHVPLVVADPSQVRLWIPMALFRRSDGSRLQVIEGAVPFAMENGKRVRWMPDIVDLSLDECSSP